MLFQKKVSSGGIRWTCMFKVRPSSLDAVSQDGHVVERRSRASSERLLDDAVNRSADNERQDHRADGGYLSGPRRGDDTSPHAAPARANDLSHLPVT